LRKIGSGAFYDAGIGIFAAAPQETRTWFPAFFALEVPKIGL
jgi:hypothetical protein